MQSKFSRLVMGLIVALCLPCVTQAQAAGAREKAASAKVATVNGVAIPKYRVDAIVRAQEAQGQSDTPELRGAIRDRLITLEVLAQEATRKGLNKNPDTMAQIEIGRANVLAQALHNDFLKRHPIGDAALKAEYEKLKAQTGEKEYKARHILVATEAEAKDIIEKLKKGEKFAELAKLSKDAGSRDHGGELDWNLPSGFVKPFSEALVKLGKGKFTETPVQTRFGWHVIQLEDTRPAHLPSFEQVKTRLEQRLQQAMFEKEIADLRAKAKVE